MPSSINQVYFENGIFVDYVGNPLPLGIAGVGVTGPTGPEGPTGENGTGATSVSLYQARKYVKEFWPPGATLLTITRAEILAATQMNATGFVPDPPFQGFQLPYGMYFGPAPTGPTASGYSVTDVHVSLYFRDLAGGTAWIKAPTDETTTGAGPAYTNKILINPSGDIIIDYRYPAGTVYAIRAVIII
jgi:hypothetical protein